MSITRSEPPHPSRSSARAATLGVLLALVVWLLPACSLLGDDSDPVADPAGATVGLPAPPDVVASLERALDRRARAVRAGDRRAFTAGLAREPRVRRAQSTYFDNMVQLPLARFDYAFDPRDVERRGDAYWVVVQVETQLAGYDARPVVSLDRYRFRPARKRPARMLLTSVTDRGWEEEHRPRVQPWDLGPVQVRGGYGVLGVFDAGSLGEAPAIIASVERGIADVSAAVPLDWRRTVVVYALSSTDFLERLEDLPGGSPERLDGVAFPVPAGPRAEGVAATRFALHPRMLARSGAERDRLVRHELVHVALGERDDRVPVWLSEGIAEYVSVRPIPRQDRLVGAAALDAALRGVDDLPSDASFLEAGEAPVVGYGLSWWICEYLASSFGEATLWTLLEELNGRDVDTEARLEELVGLTGRELARRAARAMIATFAPERLPPTAPSSLPEDLSEEVAGDGQVAEPSGSSDRRRRSAS
ncbi:hypothetical protein [Nocardioides sp. SYSU DS0663]|uniref:hypothetical protein n=1 Tax=Nocardioides sp. SYSU DS0663 TaxID=3416445 RepID=UPI003F4B481C